MKPSPGPASGSPHIPVLRSLHDLGIENFDGLFSRRVVAFPAYVDRARDNCPLHTAIDTDLNYRASRALFAGTVLDEKVLFGDTR